MILLDWDKIMKDSNEQKFIGQRIPNGMLEDSIREICGGLQRAQTR